LIASFDPSVILKDLFFEAITAANPEKCLPHNLPLQPRGKTLVVGAGKASGMMAKVVEEQWNSEISGLVITPYGYGVNCNRIEIIEGGHPLPDSAGLRAARRIYQLVQKLDPHSTIIALFSGGGSSLLTMPANNITLAEKREVNLSLLRSGATIKEINCVRKHLSKIKGGQLAKVARCTRIITLAISDVAGNDLSAIASGPTVPDNSTYRDARQILHNYKVKLPKAVSEYLEAAEEETPKLGDPIFDNNEIHIIATPSESLSAAAKLGKKLGFTVFSLGDKIEGEAHIVGKKHAQLALTCKIGQGPVAPPCILLSGGETTVTVNGQGCGGPNTEYLMGLMFELQGAHGIYSIACDTDGIDGTKDNAGALVFPDTLTRAEKLNIDPRVFLERNDSFSFFSKLGDLVYTGPTFTNVNDFRALVICP